MFHDLVSFALEVDEDLILLLNLFLLVHYLFSNSILEGHEMFRVSSEALVTGAAYPGDIWSADREVLSEIPGEDLSLQLGVQVLGSRHDLLEGD